MGDQERYQALFRASYEDLLRFVERRLHPLGAEDVVAEVFLVAWRRLPEVPADLDSARAWLFGVAHRTMANQRRGDARRDRLTSRVGTDLPADLATPDGSEAVISQVDLARAWCRLAPPDQEALTLTALDGLTGSQAAHLLGISRAAFSVRLLRARRRLRQQLDHPGPSAPSTPTSPGAQTSTSRGARR
jgi:RNA polymerase sigma-70 factor, ECF subfamily